MFIIKTKLKSIGFILICIGALLFILIRCDVFMPKYPMYDKLSKLYFDNKESFNIAYKYLLRKNPDERQVVFFNKSNIENEKANMTDEEYKALSDIFNNKLVEYYDQIKNDNYDYNNNGKFRINKHYKNVTISICYIPDNQKKDSCKHIADNWYVYYYYPRNE